jgi:hypothetical protein
MASQRWGEPTEEWAELELLLEWPEQVEYERTRPAAIFGSSVAERSRQTGTPETTLLRNITSFKSHGIRARGPGGLLASQTQPRQTLTCPSRTILVPPIHVTGSSPGESVNIRPSLQV